MRRCDRTREHRLLVLAACEAATVLYNRRRSEERRSRRLWLAKAALSVGGVSLVVLLIALAGHRPAAALLAGWEAAELWKLTRWARAHRAEYGRWPWRGVR